MQTTRRVFNRISAFLSNAFVAWSTSGALTATNLRRVRG